MKPSASWLAKFCFFGFLLLFLTPFLFPIYKDGVLILLDEFPANPNQVQQNGLQNEEEINDLETTIDLVNFLLAALTVVPILSGFLLWGLKQQIGKDLASEAKKSMEEGNSKTENLLKEKVGDFEELLKEKVGDFEEELNELINKKRKAIDELELADYLDLIRFSVSEQLIPLIKGEYGKTFKRSIGEGFPSSSTFETIEPSLKLRIKEYTGLFARLLTNHPKIFKETLCDNYSWIGEAYFLLNQPKEAHEFYEKALSQKSEDSRTLCNLGNVLKALKRFEEALDKYNEALKYINPGSNNYSRDFHSWIYYHRAKANYDLHRYEKAVLDYEESQKINPDNYQSLYWKGNALSGLGEFSQAIDAYELALKILEKVRGLCNLDASEYNPAYMWVLHGMGDAYRKIGYSCYIGDHECEQIKECSSRNSCYYKALDCYERAKEFGSENFEIFQKLGKTKRQLGLYLEALEDYKTAVYICEQQGQGYVPNLISNQASVLQVLNSPDADSKFQEAIRQCKVQIYRYENGQEIDDSYCMKKAGCYFDLARCYSLQNEPLKAHKNIEKAESFGSPEYKELVRKWAETDSDFENWYKWYKQQQKELLQSAH